MPTAPLDRKRFYDFALLIAGINMRLVLLSLFSLTLGVSAFSANSSITGEQIRLKNLAIALESYMSASNGTVPVELGALKNYIDLPQLLRPDTDPNGLFTTRYAFLPSAPWVEVPGEAPRQLLLLSVKAFSDGKRGAIWRYANGKYSAGMIEEKELQSGVKGFDLTNLKPMGGDIPAPTHPFPDAPITEYQAKVIQLVREGKITPEPRNPAGKMPKGASEPSPGPPEGVSPRMSPAPITPSIATSESQVAAAVERRVSIWPWAVGILALVVIVALVLKRRA